MNSNAMILFIMVLKLWCEFNGSIKTPFKVYLLQIVLFKLNVVILQTSKKYPKLTKDLFAKNQLCKLVIKTHYGPNEINEKTFSDHFNQRLTKTLKTQPNYQNIPKVSRTKPNLHLGKKSPSDLVKSLKLKNDFSNLDYWLYSTMLSFQLSKFKKLF